jgi:hypothetical protein
MPSDVGGMTNLLPRVCVSLAIVLCLLASACGVNSEPDHFSSGYNTAIERLDRASQQVIDLAPARKTSSSRAIARQLDSFADVLAGTRRELARLKPPDRATKQFSELVGALDKTVAAGRSAAAAARAIEPARQRRALRQLRDAAVQVAHAQDALGRAVEGSSG